MGFIQKRRKKIINGFTLIELLVVVGILAVILAITLIAINPVKQFNITSDLAASAITQDFIKANMQHLAANRNFPWDADINCSDELTSGGTLFEMPNCLTQLTKGGEIDESYRKNPGLKNIYANKCGSTVVLCYEPKTKEVLSDAKYDKFGVNNPGCPGNMASGGECYWCKPISNSNDCNIGVSPTPTTTIIPPPTFPQLVPGYENDETKLMRTYAVFLYEHPGFPPPPIGWSIHFSTREDFGGDHTQTNLFFATGNTYSHTLQNASYTAYHLITDKYVSFQSLAGEYDIYKNNCGQTVYWRVANYYLNSASDKKVGPTYTGVIDCTTQVGIVDPPLSWFTVYDQLNGVQKQYDASWDFDTSGNIDWVDYWLGAFSTKTRYGGWQLPE